MIVESIEDPKEFNFNRPVYQLDLYIGEGATMASECAMLGTPAMYINTLGAGTLEEQEKYGLIFCYKSQTEINE